MYELVQVSETCFYVQSPAKIGVIRNLLNKVLPKGQDNREVMGKHNYTNTVKVKEILTCSKS